MKQLMPPARGVILLWLCLLSPLWTKAQSSADRSAEAAPAIHIWYGPEQHFGQRGEPQRWVNVLGNVSRPEQLDSVTYVLNASPPQRLSLGSDLHRLAMPGDFNVELAWDDLNAGNNQLLITAYAKVGGPITEQVTLVIERGNTWPLPYRIDFSEVDRLQEVVQVVDGHWQLGADGVRTVQRYYDRVLSMGDTSWSDFETTVRLTVHDFTPSEPGPPTYDVTHFGVAMRWRGHHRDGRQPSRKWFPLGAQGEFLLKDDLDSCRWRILFDGRKEKPNKYTNHRNQLTLGRPIRVKTQVATLPDGRTRYRFKQWADDASEPLGWDVEGFETGDYPSGALCLVPHNSDVTIHEVWVEPLVTPPVQTAARPGPGAIHFSAPVGGTFGVQGQTFSTDFLTHGKLIALQVNLAPAPARIVRGLRFRIQQADGHETTTLIGAETGQWQEWFSVPDGAALTGISGASGWYLDALQFYFSNGLRSPRYGGEGGDTEFQLLLRKPGSNGPNRVRGFHDTATEFGLETIGLIFDPAE